jgi:hypothetical protein
VFKAIRISKILRIGNMETVIDSQGGQKRIQLCILRLTPRRAQDSAKVKTAIS